MDNPKMLAAYGINKILLDKGFNEEEAHELECGILKALVSMVTAKMERSTTNELNEYVENILSRLFNTVRTIKELNEHIKRVHDQGGGTVYIPDGIYFLDTKKEATKR